MENFNSEIQLIELEESTIIPKGKLTFELIEKINATVILNDNIFHLVDKEHNTDPLITYYEGNWWANRYVGESVFTFKDITYRLIVTPRFGELFLFKLLENIFNFQFNTSHHKLTDNKNDSNFIKRIIAKIWLLKLIQANKYGLPRRNKKTVHIGSQIRGKFEVRKSIISLKTKQQLVSSYYEKTIDSEIAAILYRSFIILSSDYGMPAINKLPTSAKEILHQLELSKNTFSNSDYNINIKDISPVYKSYTEVLKLSIDIIKKRDKDNIESQLKSDGFSFFLDMAEIWELYLKNLFEKEFSADGWDIKSPVIDVYKDKFFERKLIPDIVLQRNNDILLFDAKYKYMRGIKKDIDRADFFQIHTYMSYFNKSHNLKLAGLLYPFSFKIDNHKKISESIILKETKFIIDGIDFSEFKSFLTNEEKEIYFNKSASDFIKNIKKYDINNWMHNT